MRRVTACSLFALLAFADVWANGSDPAVKRPLSKPDFDLCQTRPDTFRFGTHRYLLSWMTNSSKEEQKLDWMASRNFCRKRCMDTVAVDTPAEWTFLLGAIRRTTSGATAAAGNEDLAFAVWTSGRLCDFEGCERLDAVKPHSVNGWFWAASNQRMSPASCVDGVGNCFHVWSDTGKYGYPQPDNRELREDGLDGNESCLAVLVDAYDDGAKWHDRACYHRAHFICEDSGILLNYVRKRAKKIASKKVGNVQINL